MTPLFPTERLGWNEDAVFLQTDGASDPPRQGQQDTHEFEPLLSDSVSPGSFFFLPR